MISFPKVYNQLKKIKVFEENKSNKRILTFTVTPHWHNYLLLISGIITGLTVFLSPILIPIVFPKYIEAIEVIQIMGFALVPSALTLILTSELLGKENSKSVILGVLIAIITLIIGIITLGQNFGIIGLALSLVIARILQCCTLLILKNRMIT